MGQDMRDWAEHEARLRRDTEMAEARTTIDRLTVEKAVLVEREATLVVRVRVLEEENEALRRMVAHVTTGGRV